MKINFKVILFVVLFLFGSYNVLNVENNKEVYVLSDNSSYENDYKQKDDNQYSIDKITTEEDNNEAKENNFENKDEITVFISGEVKSPGIITVENGKRLFDAVNELGGVTDAADLNKVNLAVKLQDEAHYVIPKIGEETEITENVTQNNNLNNSNNKNTNDINKVNINKADSTELDSLPGVGPSTAEKIISYREQNGEFGSIEEIKNVTGIGDKKYEQLKDFIDIK